MSGDKTKSRQHNHNKLTHRYEKQRTRTAQNKLRRIRRHNGEAAHTARVKANFGVRSEEVV